MRLPHLQPQHDFANERYLAPAAAVQDDLDIARIEAALQKNYQRDFLYVGDIWQHGQWFAQFEYNWGGAH